LEQLFAAFGLRLRWKSDIPEAAFGSFWSSQLKIVLMNFVSTVSLQEQEQWRVMANAVKSRVSDGPKVKVVAPSGGSTSKASNPTRVGSISQPSRAICLKYLKNALGLLNPQSGIVYENCSKADCERYHNDIFQKSKQQVVALVAALKGDNSVLTDAVMSDPRFK
jgi:hypothetical protein